MLMTKTFEVGILGTNCYIANCRDTLQAAAIDPGFSSIEEAEAVISFIKDNKLELKFIVNTHGHPDHTCGNVILKDIFQAPICIHQNDAHMIGKSGKETSKYFGYECESPPADILLCEGSTIELGNVTLKVIYTPGHSFGSISLIGETEVFTGDALFAGSVGRTDFPGSSDVEMRSSLRRLKQLPDYFTVYPGHGPKTTIGEEKKVNPFLLGV